MALDALRCNHLAPLGFKGLKGWLKVMSLEVPAESVGTVAAHRGGGRQFQILGDVTEKLRTHSDVGEQIGTGGR